MNALDKTIVGYRDIRPNHSCQLVLCDEPMSVADQVAQHRKTLAPESDRFPGFVQDQLVVEVDRDAIDGEHFRKTHVAPPPKRYRRKAPNLAHLAFAAHIT